MQTAVVLSVVALCVAYAAWRCLLVVRQRKDPCSGCALSERCRGRESHYPQGHRMSECQHPGMKAEARGLGRPAVEVVADDRQT